MNERKPNIIERGAFNALYVVYVIVALCPILLIVYAINSWPPPDWVIDFFHFFPVSFGWEASRNDVLLTLACWLLAPGLPLLLVLSIAMGYFKNGFYETARFCAFVFGFLCIGWLAWEIWRMISKLQ